MASWIARTRDSAPGAGSRDPSTRPRTTPARSLQQTTFKVGELIAEEDNSNLKLRVFISGGGCSGFQYGFTFDEDIEDGDSQVENQGVTLLIDPMSVQYLMGAEIDYKDDLQGAQFIIRNPNAQTTCGCGSSFTV